MPDPGEDLLRKALAGAVAGLDESRRLTVVEVAADGITTFDLRRDELGRPRCRFDPVVPWTSLAAGRGWDGAGHDLTRQDPTEEAVIRAAGVPSHAALILVCSFPDSPLAGQALAWLHAAFPEAAAFVQADVRVDALLRDVVVNDPLDRPYELVVLKRSVATGRFELAAHQLFTIGARAGEVARVTARCEAGDERGTAFAVVAWGRRPLLLSLQSARLVPGHYDFTVELERPGRVRLTGLPGLVRDDRSWADLVAAVPRGLDTRTDSQHLICAVEISGAPGDVAKRLERLHQMVATMSAGAPGLLEVSLVTYGAHSYDRRVPEGEVEVVDWLVSPGHALASLTGLEGRPRRRRATRTARSWRTCWPRWSAGSPSAGPSGRCCSRSATGRRIRPGWTGRSCPARTGTTGACCWAGSNSIRAWRSERSATGTSGRPTPSGPVWARRR